MHVIAKRNLLLFCHRHPAARRFLLAWHEETVEATWRTPLDIKLSYSTASFVGRNRVVFSIKGKSFRLIVAVAYDPGAACIKLFGTHAEYDRIDAATVEME